MTVHEPPPSTPVGHAPAVDKPRRRWRVRKADYLREIAELRQLAEKRGELLAEALAALQDTGRSVYRVSAVGIVGWAAFAVAVVWR